MIDRIKKSIPNSFKWTIRNNMGRIRNAGKNKIFGIGLNKTGTTSLTAAMSEFGYTVGDERPKENLIFDWAKRDFSRIIKKCYSAQFFQDVPFSKPFTYVVIDQKFPGSKFILTVRDSPEQWYRSLVNFHGKLWGKDGNIPTKEDLMTAEHVTKGRPWKVNRLSYNTPEEDPYNEEILKHYYTEYNRSVIEYFRHRPSDLLILNVAEKDAYLKLCNFLNEVPKRDDFPWRNKTKEV